MKFRAMISSPEVNGEREYKDKNKFLKTLGSILDDLKFAEKCFITLIKEETGKKVLINNKKETWIVPEKIPTKIHRNRSHSRVRAKDMDTIKKEIEEVIKNKTEEKKGKKYVWISTKELAKETGFALKTLSNHMMVLRGVRDKKWKSNHIHTKKIKGGAYMYRFKKIGGNKK